MSPDGFQALRLLHAVMEQVLQHGLTDALAESGLSLTQLTALRYLNHTHEADLSQLAAAFNISKPAVTKLLSRLEAGGWATRSEVEADRRKVVPQLTGKAVETLAKLDGVEAALLTRVATRLSADDRQALTQGAVAYIRATIGNELSEQFCLYCGNQHRPDCPLSE